MNELIQSNTVRRYFTISILISILTLLLLHFVYTAHAQTPVPSATSSAKVVSEELSTAPENKGYTIEALQIPAGKPPSDFVVGPGKTELTIKPGESKTSEILVSNRTGETRIFSFVVEDAEGSNDLTKSVVLLGADTGPYTLKDYIKLPQTRIELKNNERARIPVVISVPQDAEAGGRYGSVLVTTATKDASTGDETGMTPSSAIVSRIGTLFFLTIPGDTNIEGNLHSFTTLSLKKFFTEGPIKFQILFDNKGDLHLNPYGEVRIKNFAGEEVGFVELDPWFALPRSTRAREVEWSRDLLIGRYEATLNLNRGYDDIIDTQTIYFWVLPWKIIGSVFAILFVFFFCIRFFTRTFEFKRKGT